jgi:hypothetical protein
MTNSTKVFLTGLAVLAGAASAQAAIINIPYAFDTVAEQNLWTVTATPYNGNTPIPEYYSNGITYGGPETRTGSDTNLGVYPDRTGGLDFVTRIDAPAGEVFTSIVASADGAAFPNWGYTTSLQLSHDGTTFDLVEDAPTSYSTAPVTVTGTGMPGYAGLSSVWLKVHMWDYYGFYSAGARYERVENIVFNGETAPVPEPATGALMVIGAGFLLARRRGMAAHS